MENNYRYENKKKFHDEEESAMETKDSKLEIKINDGEKKSDDKAIKILGWWVNQQMNLKTNLMNMKGIVNMKICQLKSYLQYMTMK